MKLDKKEVLNFLARMIFVSVILSFMIYLYVAADPDLTEHDRRKAVHAFFKGDFARIQLADKSIIKPFEEGGKSGSSILDTVRIRTDLDKEESIHRVDGELKRLGWPFWKKENEGFVYCKDKFIGEVVFSNYEPENSTDIDFTFTLGLMEKNLFENDFPSECKSK